MSREISFKGPPVCVVGNINRDVKVHGVPGESAVLHDGETTVSEITETVGGGGANSACAAAALGTKVRFVGKVGADPLGESLCQAVQRHGVEAYLSRSPGLATGTTVALGFATGQRHFLSCLPNNRSLNFEDIDIDALDGCGHLLRGDVWFSESMLEKGNRLLFTEAKRRGLATSLDINFDPCWSSGPKAGIARRKKLLRDILEYVDLAHGNARELCEFTDTMVLEHALEQLLQWGVKAVVVHLGAQGAGYFKKGEWVVEPPDLANDPVQSTGTGDVLSICMILLHNRKDLGIREKLKAANSVVREFMEGRLKLIPSI